MSKNKRTVFIVALVFASAVFVHVRRSRAAISFNAGNNGYRVACLKSAAARTGADQKLKGKYHIKYSTNEIPQYVCYFNFTSNPPKCVQPRTKGYHSYKLEYAGAGAGLICLFEDLTHQSLIQTLQQGPTLEKLGNPFVFGTWERVAEHLQSQPVLAEPMEIE